MSIFAVITDLEIINPPAWYDTFTTKYLSRPKPHITLIQPRYVTEEQGRDLLHSLATDLANFRDMFPIHDTASGIRLFDDKRGFLIGIDNKQVIDFQAALRDRIPKELAFVNPVGARYEQEFWPHLTMADMIPATDFADIMKEYDIENLRFDIRVNKILCTLPRDFSVEESLKEENYHVMLP